jgi:hypothetical protein
MHNASIPILPHTSSAVTCLHQRSRQAHAVGSTHAGVYQHSRRPKSAQITTVVQRPSSSSTPAGTSSPAAAPAFPPAAAAAKDATASSSKTKPSRSRKSKQSKHQADTAASEAGTAAPEAVAAAGAAAAGLSGSPSFELPAPAGVPGAPQPSPLDAGFSSVPGPWAGGDMGQLDFAPLAPLPQPSAPMQPPELPSIQVRVTVALCHTVLCAHRQGTLQRISVRFCTGVLQLQWVSPSMLCTASALAKAICAPVYSMLQNTNTALPSAAHPAADIEHTLSPCCMQSCQFHVVLSVQVEPPAKAVTKAELAALPTDPSLPSMRERAHIAMRASGAAMEASQRAAAYSAAASSAASRAAEAAEQAATAAAAVQVCWAGLYASAQYGRCCHAWPL